MYQCILNFFPVILAESEPFFHALEANYEIGVLTAFGAMMRRDEGTCRGQVTWKT